MRVLALYKKTITTLLSSGLFLLISNSSYAVPSVTGEPVIVQHLGAVVWVQDDPVTTPNLTQPGVNDINDLHGDVSCDLIISTPGNYHMALKDAMKGRPDLGHVGLQEQLNTPTGPNVTVCWSTSPPVSIDQISAKSLQFKNINLKGRPALAMAPGGVMNQLIAANAVHTVQPLLTNRGNVILIRSDKVGYINNICDLGGSTRVVTPHPTLEPGSFGNFSGTIFNVANDNPQFGCSDDPNGDPTLLFATQLFNDIFSQDPSTFDLTVFDNPYNIDGVMSVFGKGSTPQGLQGAGVKWVASSRIMHRDIPYALCNNEADAAVIFYHQAIYIKDALAATGCELEIVPMGGTVANPQPLPGNKVGALKIAKVKGAFSPEIKNARTLIQDFLTTSPIWGQILAEYGMTQ